MGAAGDAELIDLAERSRVRYNRLGDGQVVTVSELMKHVRHAPGPRLVILNTVQNAAVVAEAMRSANFDVLLQWNKSTVYTKTVAYFASRLAGGG